MDGAHVRGLARPDRVSCARAGAEAAGLDRADAQEALADLSVKDELRDATDAAHARGVFGVPTVEVQGELFWGDDRLEEAAAALARNGASR